jgi:hypothetical protein
MPALVLWLTRLVPWFLSSVIGDNVLRFVAGKALLSALFLVVLPLVLNNFMYDIINMTLSIVNDTSSGSTFNGALQYTGLAAHWLNVLRVPECMAVIVSALSVRVSLSLIPFVRV